MVGLLLLAFAFRPGSAIYRIPHRRASRASRRRPSSPTVAIEVALYGRVPCSWARTSWRSHAGLQLAARGTARAREHLRGWAATTRSSTPSWPRPWRTASCTWRRSRPRGCKDMDDPYDKGARDEAQKETGEPYLFDRGHHDGHHYVYFGVVPVAAVLPALLSCSPGAEFPTAIGVLVHGAAVHAWDATALCSTGSPATISSSGEPRCCTCCFRYRSCSAAASCIW
ncbi:MAG: hypothetical protein ACLTDR_14770 [Adlercreutzia equolifaciens]